MTPSAFPYVGVGLAALALACASPQALPPLPPPTDVEMLLWPTPSPPAVPITLNLPDGPDRAIDEGQCRDLPAGFWVSERRFAERITAVAARDRFRIEVDALRKLRLEERAAYADIDQALRLRLSAAERSSDRRLWLGIAIGAGTILLSGWAVTRVGN